MLIFIFVGLDLVGLSHPHQTCDKSDIHAAIRCAMLDRLVVEPGRSRGSGPDSGESADDEASLGERLSEEQLSKIRRALLDADAAKPPPLPEHVDPRALHPALKMIETVERDPVLHKALLSLPLLRDRGGSGGAEKGPKKGGGRGGGARKGASAARPRLNLQQEVAHLMSVGVANRSLQSLLLGLKALLTLYEQTTPALQPQPSAATPPQPPPEMPQCGGVLRGLSGLRLHQWGHFLTMLEQEEENERRQAVTGKHKEGCHAGLEARVASSRVTAHSFEGSPLVILKGLECCTHHWCLSVALHMLILGHFLVVGMQAWHAWRCATAAPCRCRG
jgi:hypothetical protein